MWDSLRKIPLKLDTNIIIDTKKGLETIAKFLDLLPQLFFFLVMGCLIKQPVKVLLSVNLNFLKFMSSLYAILVYNFICI